MSESVDEQLTPEEEANLMMHILAAETFEQQADIYASYRQYARADIATAKHLLEKIDREAKDLNNTGKRISSIPWTGRKHYPLWKRCATPFMKAFAWVLIRAANVAEKRARARTQRELEENNTSP